MIDVLKSDVITIYSTKKETITSYLSLNSTGKGIIEISILMSFTRQKRDELVDFIYQKLFEIIYDNIDDLQYMKNYRLRPGYGYNRFFINKVEGECSLQSLIHYILSENLIYRDILNDYQNAQCMVIIKNQPYAIYYPTGDSDEDNEVKELLDYIYNRTIFSVAQLLILIGMDIRYDFRNYLRMYEGEGL